MRVSIGPAMSVALRAGGTDPALRHHRERGEHRNARLAHRDHVDPRPEMRSATRIVSSTYSSNPNGPSSSGTSRALCQSVR